MSSLSKDEFGFVVRAKKYGQESSRDIEDLLNKKADEMIYHSTVEGGARTAKPLNEKNSHIKVKPGDTFTVGPRINKATSPLPESLQKEVTLLKKSGFGAIDAPVKNEWGWSIRMKGLALPGGIRTDAMILLPNNYPLASPIGFYIRKDAVVGKLDTHHLFSDRAYHGANNLSEEGWQWFCGIVDNWQPGRHTLVSYLSIVFHFFNEAANK
jgi:hypothetical protein